MRLVIAAAGMALLAGCGGGHHPGTAPRSSSPVSVAGLRGSFVALSGPLHTALDRDLTAAQRALAGPDPITAAGPPIDAAGAALNRYDQQLLRLPWPPGMRSDARAVVAADLDFAGRLAAFSSQTGLSLGEWSSDLLAAEGRSAAAVSVLRVDLGLPPAR